MKSFAVSVIAAGGMAAAAVGLAGVANAAPSDNTSAAQTVNQLQSQGFHVILNKVGSGPLDQCAVSAVRPGQTYTRMESEIPGPNDRGIVTTVTAKTVYVDVTC